MAAETPELPALRLDLAQPDVEAPIAIAVLLADRNRSGARPVPRSMGLSLI